MNLKNGVIFLPRENQVYALTLPDDLAMGIALLRQAAAKAQKEGINVPLEITLPPEKPSFQNLDEVEIRS